MFGRRHKYTTLYLMSKHRIRARHHIVPVQWRETEWTEMRVQTSHYQLEYLDWSYVLYANHEAETHNLMSETIYSLIAESRL